MNDPRFDEILLNSIMENDDILPGGLADNAPDSEFDKHQLEMGTKSELEHTSNKEMAKEIAKDHLKEDPKYYTKLKKMEESAILEISSQTRKTKKRQQKQTKKQRHAKHKEWRKKNKQKVRDQVARHQAKTGQNKNREDTRRRKENGEISKNPKCSSCGSTTNVQHDHQKGYAKNAPTKPLCHKCHTNRPQQNKKGEKSVKGGTRLMAASKDKKLKWNISYIAEDLER